jgi:hypothetical protein
MAWGPQENLSISAEELAEQAEVLADAAEG